jgi:hypothetical protein
MLSKTRFRTACSVVITRDPTQVEFYFSDSNLPKDSFLKAQVDKHPHGCERQGVGPLSATSARRRRRPPPLLLVLRPLFCFPATILHLCPADLTLALLKFAADVDLSLIMSFSRMRSLLQVGVPTCFRILSSAGCLGPGQAGRPPASSAVPS